MKKQLVLCILFFVLMINLVSAVPPITTEFLGDQRYVIEANVMNMYKTNEAACVHIFVFNQTDGTIANSSKVSCKVELTNHNGTVVLESSPTAYENHFQICRPPNIITEPDTYALIMVCNDSSTYGTKTDFFEATSTGVELTVGKAILYVLFIFILLFILFAIFFIMSYLPKSNQTDEEGKILQISYLKHLRLVLWLFAYFVLIAIMFIAFNVAFGYLFEEMTGKILFAIYSILFGFAPLIVIVLMISFFVTFFQDKQFQKLLNRGIFPESKL